MDQKKIARISELSRKQRSQGLSPEELSEQAGLRKEYLQAVRTNIKATLDHTVLVENTGKTRKLRQ